MVPKFLGTVPKFLGPVPNFGRSQHVMSQRTHPHIQHANLRPLTVKNSDACDLVCQFPPPVIIRITGPFRLEKDPTLLSQLVSIQLSITIPSLYSFLQTPFQLLSTPPLSYQTRNVSCNIPYQFVTVHFSSYALQHMCHILLKIPQV